VTAEAASQRRWGPLATAWVLGLVHAVVDTASLAILYVEVHLGNLPFESIVVLILAYNVLAFGLQAPLGWLADRRRTYRPFALAGLALAVPAIAAAGQWSVFAVVAIGLGNALFHVGAGAMVLRRCGGRATTPGIFVAPGAAGVCAGIWIGLAGFPARGLLALAAAAGLVLTAIARPAAAPPAARAPGRRPPAGAAAVALCAALLCGSVAVRALAGRTISGLWAGAAVGLAITAAAVVGKMAGGWLGDRLGWRVVGVGSLLLVAPLVVLAPAHAPVAVGALLLVQLTMAVTLTATYVAMPARPGLAFGLPCLALLIGSAPALASAAGYLPGLPTASLVPLVLAAAVTIYFGLWLLRRPYRSRTDQPATQQPAASASSAGQSGTGRLVGTGGGSGAAATAANGSVAGSADRSPSTLTACNRPAGSR